MNAANESVVTRLAHAINSGQIAQMDHLFHEDAVMEWIAGGDNRRAIYGSFPSLPTIMPRRMLSRDDLVVFEASMDYGEGGRYNAVFVFEFRGDRIAKETAYWATPFDAPDWRSEWVEPIA
jgi:ketosteroid isomerase-like protein